MKLLQCSGCGSIFNLALQHLKSCDCGRTQGFYRDNRLAFYTGPSVPIGFDNQSFHHAKLERPPEGRGTGFNAFIVPILCPTFIHLTGKSFRQAWRQIQKETA